MTESTEPADASSTPSSTVIAAPPISVMTTAAYTEDLLQLASLCNVAHLESCDCQQQRISVMEQKFFALTEEELIRKGVMADLGLVSRRKARDRYDARVAVAQELMEEHVTCPKEQKIIQQELELFDKTKGGKYDLTDARTAVIVRSLIDQLLSIDRMQKIVQSHGVVLYDDNGRAYLHPVESEKRKYSEARVKAIKVLDEIMEGQKHKILNVHVFKPEEIFGSADESAAAEELRSIE